MRRIENQRLGDAEMTQVFATACAHTETAVEHLQRHPRAQRPQRTTKTDGTGREIAIAPIQHWNAAAPACCDSPQVERRMPAWHNDNVGPRLCDRVCDGSHVGAAKTLGLETTAVCRWLKNAMRVPIGKRHIPLNRPPKAAH